MNQGKVSDFSKSGLSVLLNNFYSVGVQLDIELDLHDDLLNTRLAEEQTHQLRCEVRWGRPVDGGLFRHGLEIKSLNLSQRETLLTALREKTKIEMNLAS